MLSSIGPSNAGKIQCVVMDFHAENENTVLRSFDLYFFKSPGHKNTSETLVEVNQAIISLVV